MLELPPVPTWQSSMDRFARWFPVVLVLTLPLEFTKQAFPVQLLDVSRLVLMLGVVVLAVQVLVLRRPVRIPAQLSFLLLIAFVGLATVSWMLTRSSEGLKSTAALYAYLAMLVLLYNWLGDETALRRTWRALAVSGVLIGVAGTALYAARVSLWAGDQLPRAYATFGDPNITARFLALSAAAGVIVAAHADSRRWRLLAVASAVVAGIAIPFTFSRQGYVLFFIALVAGVAVVRLRRAGAVAAGAGAAAFALMLVLFPATASRVDDAALHALNPVLQQRLPDGRKTDLGWVDRLPVDVERRYLIAAGLQMFEDHPLTGVGEGGFQHAMETTYAAYIQRGYFDVASHTSLVTVLAEEGVPGLVLLLVLVVQLFRETRRSARSATGETREMMLAAALMLGVILLASQLEGRLFPEPYLWLFLGLLYAAQGGRSLEWARRTEPAIRPATAPGSTAVSGRTG